jgi:hypothetical protein
MLVIIAATREGKTELVGFQVGARARRFGRALRSSPLVSPDRELVCHRPSSHGAEQGRAVAGNDRLMVCKLMMAAAKSWRRLKGEKQLPKVIDGVRFKDGVEITTVDAKDAARSGCHPYSVIVWRRSQGDNVPTVRYPADARLRA